MFPLSQETVLEILNYYDHLPLQIYQEFVLNFLEQKDLHNEKNIQLFIKFVLGQKKIQLRKRFKLPFYAVNIDIGCNDNYVDVYTSVYDLYQNHNTFSTKISFQEWVDVTFY